MMVQSAKIEYINALKVNGAKLRAKGIAEAIKAITNSM